MFASVTGGTSLLQTSLLTRLRQSIIFGYIEPDKPYHQPEFHTYPLKYLSTDHKIRTPKINN